MLSPTPTALLSAARRVDPLPRLSGSPEVWSLRSRDIDPGALDERVLDAEERRRATAFQRSVDRTTYVAAHVVLRQLLARRLDLSAEEIAFERAPCPRCGQPHGRPGLAGPKGSVPEFSLSHSAGLILVAVATRPVGVDAEAFPADATVAAGCGLLPPAERARVEAAPPRERPAAFASAWTRHEAQLKAIGTGIVDGPRIGGPLRGHRSGWTVVDLPVDPGYAASLAIHA